MKTILVIVSVILAAFTVSQAYINKGVAETEEQPYDVIWNDGELEVRFYPKAVMATVNNSTSIYKNSSNQNFRVLAGYIFGANEEQKSIAMTSPVHMSFGKSGSRMSFIMPRGMSTESLPKPNDRGVKLSETNEMYVVAIRFGGWADDEKIAKYAQRLIDLLSDQGLVIESEPWYLGYNPPYQLVNRRNEVAAKLTKEQILLLTSK
jgi:hypothetical protein